MSELRIIVATHKPYRMPEGSCYLPLQVGAFGKPSLGPEYRRDDEGENISARNSSWCELTGLYWAWKNLRADALGLVHYRRLFRGAKGVATEAEFAALLHQADLILPRPRNYFIETTRSQYVHAHHAEDLDATRAVIDARCPDYLAAFDRVMASTRGHRFNMFVMTRPLLDGYCTWLFDVLFEVERRLDISSYSAYDARVFGFLAERLLDVWVVRNGIRHLDLPVLHLESQHWPRKIAAFIMRKLGGGRCGKAGAWVKGEGTSAG